MDAGASFPFSFPPKRGWSAPDLGFTRDRLVYVRKSGVPDLRWRQRVCETLFGGALRSAPPEAGEASAPVGVGAAPPGAPPQTSLRSLRTLDCFRCRTCPGI